MKKISIMTDDKIIREKVVDIVSKMGADFVITGISANISSAVLDIMKNKPNCIIFAINDFNKSMKFFDAQNIIVIRTDRMADPTLIKGERINENEINIKLEKILREKVKDNKEEELEKERIEKIKKEITARKAETKNQYVENEADARNRKSKKIDLVVIGISTGGPYALKEVIPFIKEDISVPIVIVQHMPAGFTKDLAKGLNMASKIEVVEANTENLKKGVAYVLPGGRNTGIVSNGGNLSFKPFHEKYGFYTPSVDYMLESLAEIKQTNPLVIIMTGMGNDGTQGVKKLRSECKGFFITQSKESCVVYGMPRVVDESGYSDLSGINVTDIASEINKRV